jgi:hypothetical protein
MKQVETSQMKELSRKHVFSANFYVFLKGIQAQLKNNFSALFYTLKQHPLLTPQL